MGFYPGTAHGGPLDGSGVVVIHDLGFVLVSEQQARYWIYDRVDADFNCRDEAGAELVDAAAVRAEYADDWDVIDYA